MQRNALTRARRGAESSGRRRQWSALALSIGGGTSAATPAFAGIVAISDQYAKRRLGLLNPTLYRLERRHARGIIDVTKGNNTVSFQVQDGSAVKTFTLKGYRAKPGYDLVTGVGTVDAGRLVPELARR